MVRSRRHRVACGFAVASSIVLNVVSRSRRESFVAWTNLWRPRQLQRPLCSGDGFVSGIIASGLLVECSSTSVWAADLNETGFAVTSPSLAIAVATLFVAIVLLRPSLFFEFLRNLRTHPSFAQGRRMEAWAEPEVPFGNFAQHVTMCPYKVITQMLNVGAAQNGMVIDYRLFDPGIFIADNDAAVKEVLSRKITRDAKRSLGENLPPYERLFGKSLFMVTSDSWERQHRITSSKFTNKQMELSSSLVAEQVDAEFRRLELAISGKRGSISTEEQMQIREDLGVEIGPEGKVLIQPQAFATNIVSRVLTHVAFGQGMSEEERDTVLQCFKTMYESSLSPTIALPGYLDAPVEGARKMREAIADLHRVGYKFVNRQREARAGTEGRSKGLTLLSAMLDARDEDNDLLSDEEVVHNVFGFMVAGVATTGCSLATTCFMLARHPSMQKRLQDEVAEANSWEDIKLLPYLSAFITEQLRLWPPLIGVPPRTMAEDVTIQGVDVPKGTDVAIYGLASHRRKHVWGDDAEEFRPERYLEKALKNPVMPSPMPSGVPDEAFVTFGGGLRPCIARPLAMVEMKLVLMQLAQRYTLMETQPEKFGMQVAFPVVFPKQELRLELVPRTDLRTPI
eukprot:TRINITY_DN44651_c0_g1_i1.p1 TRINITY_DN44651_c0_g1~~TRINITY_DN44651_c0_g1_i1.p1  ORF type:complete len:624 (+),score=103.74 TRINITY_DN44651_c0_g1_i1:43-1914(+)